MPLLPLEEVFDISFSMAAFVDADDCAVSVEGRRLGGERGWRGVLEKEFFDAFPDIFHGELRFIQFVPRSHKDDSGTLRNVVSLPEILSYLSDSLFQIGSEVVFVHVEAVFLHQALQVLALGVDVLEGLVDSVLAGVLARELESVLATHDKGHSIVNEIEVFQGPLLEVFHEPVIIVSPRQIIGPRAVEFREVFHELEGHVLIVNAEDDTGFSLIDLLWQIRPH
mmetsp:Transcript_17296/g.16502  ORF Transcript_17296/g.16502 Transcript_17296/m.16502 type:complete len:224 (+) Transcript_17296:581-1252(+)|eukprot:CAMPEP_0170543090 /NCGR_PEP_ID=MMETSP0211-20121228/2321_1 /TAXON_ID=311385 /ORGANISM="Pseudokeronopsis sp., Strain OXSARD2" /LENGTH=223 /DNA_ID=CAMNT_0010846375 /DNA_START=545 /DNA_END=1216 /DNA_ORIENTATION=+